MRFDLKKQPAWMQLLLFGGITFVIAFLGSFLGHILVYRANHIPLAKIALLGADDYSKPEYAGLAKGLLVVQFFSFFLLPSLVFAYFADSRPLAFAGMRRPGRWRFLWLGALMMLFAYMMVEWLGQINQDLVQYFLGKHAQEWIAKGESDVAGTLQNILDLKSLKGLLESIFLVGLLAAVGEELFFRGIMQRIFIQIFKSPWMGIIITSAIFSAVHGQFLGFIPRMILGMILGALYWYSGSIFIAMAGHFVYNSLQILLVYFKIIDINQESGPTTRWVSVLGILSLMVVGYLLNYLRKHSRASYQAVYGDNTLNVEGPGNT